MELTLDERTSILNEIGKHLYLTDIRKEKINKINESIDKIPEDKTIRDSDDMRQRTVSGTGDTSVKNI